MVYATKNMEGFISWLQSKDGFIAQVEALMLLSTLLFAIKVVFGWWRRSSSNVVIKYSLWLAYTLNPIVATYTLGFISSFLYGVGYGFNNNDKPLIDDAWLLFYWSLVLVLALGGTYSMTAYNVDDNKQYTKNLLQHALYVLNMIAGTRLLAFSSGTWLLVGVSFFLLLWPARIASTSASMMANSFSEKSSLFFQAYMKKEHLMSSTDICDPVTLVGYNYLLFKRKGKYFTVSQVYQMNLDEVGIRGSDGKRLKEICLSYALSHLLKRRFFGAACHEASHGKTHDFVFKGLLSNVEENYQAAYRVIETELAFTHDCFFTTSPSLLIWTCWKTVFFVVPILFSWVPPVMTVSKQRSIMTTVNMLMLVALELLQLYLWLSSDHSRVQLITSSIMFATPSKDHTALQILRLFWKLPKLIGCWQNKIGQHSLLKDLHSRSIISDVMGSLSLICKRLLGSPPAFPRGIRNPGVKDPDRISLTDRVKKAIAQALKSSGGHLSNGTSSLQHNDQLQLSDEFLLGKSHARDILVWHLATEYCDIGQSQRQGDFAANRDVATTISRYCAYLMAFVPELLPDHQLETSAVFHQTRNEALGRLREEKTLEAKYSKLSGNINGQPPPQNENTNHVQPPPQSGITIDGQSALQNVSDGQPDSLGVEIFDSGIELGKRLQVITDDGRRWKILADFWTEMILYVAPSDNARDHIQHLANGGEFITHLWALLTHAGILDRGQRNVASDIENPGEGSSHRSRSTTQDAPSTNEPATTTGNCSVQTTSPVQNVEGSPSARIARSGMEDID